MKIMLVIAALCWAATFQPIQLWAAENHHDHETETHDEQAEQPVDDHDDHGEDDHEEEQTTTISDDNAQTSGIRTALAGPGDLARTVKTYGRVVVPSDQISHIRARFPGLVKDVAVGIGDAVEAGDLLARVEANESLKSYSIKAPITGIVTERHANAGELAQDQVLFSIVNPVRLWAELRVFEGQLGDIRVEQPLRLSSATQETRSVIKNIMPSLDEHPFVIARAELDNTAGIWSPGMFVEADVVVETSNVSLAIDNRALQTLDGQRGVFIQRGELYEFHPLTLGRSDGRFTEVLDGLSYGDRYVVENSYLIKADIEKSGAEHEH